MAVTEPWSENKRQKRQAKKYGDSNCLLFFMDNGLYMLLNPIASLKWLAIGFFQMQIALGANFAGSFLRWKHGSQTMGLISTLMMVNTLIVFNSTECWWIAKPIVAPLSPLFAYWSDSSLWDLILVYVHSIPLLVTTILYAMLGVAHSVMIYLGKGNDSLTKRGDSWMVTLLHKYTDWTINEYFIAGIVEPLLCIAAGLIAWATDDLVYASFLWFSGFCVFLQEMRDHGWVLRNKSMA